MFKDKITNDEKYKNLLLEEFKKVEEELNKFTEDIENVSITEEMLKSFWIPPSINIDYSTNINDDNNLLVRKIEDTPRYKYHKAMENIENVNLIRRNNLSIGDINSICSIRDDRINDELDNIETNFNISESGLKRCRIKLITIPEGDNIAKLKKLHNKFPIKYAVRAAPIKYIKR